MKKQRSLTETDHKAKAAALCSKSEQCRQDVWQKLIRWKCPEEDIPVIIEELATEGFIDEKRYACAFVRDKFRFNQWGRNKIRYALKQKGIPEASISHALEEIGPEEYKQCLTKLMQRKHKQVQHKPKEKQMPAVINYLAGKGFEYEIIKEITGPFL